ncbi:helix-turn-helix domain-containing protein [Litchfieldia salsa]|uniref:Helix-turn-helix domain-containing protein n=1 Tax=Litchfieldia salsa TaxID=930152 RepID=A0A1H0VYG0_9BACI|nr:helix-turn-helix domain-containing protein [Litchfieldia salsa]SDP83265.1 Helix-turn-helix domain-containing protein [Litchfieldia salsa]
MKHKPRYFYRLFIPFVLVGTLAMLLFNGFAFLFTKDSLEEKIIYEKQENVVQTMNTLEQKLQALDYTFNSYIHDSSYKNYISNPLTPSQFDTYQLIDKQLNYISSFGPSRTTVELVSLEGNWMINEDGLKQLTTEQEDEITAKYLSLPNSSTWFKDEQDNRIKLVKKTPFYQTLKSGLLIIDIPIKSLSNVIYKHSETSPIYIYNQDGMLVYQSNSDMEDTINEKTISDLINGNKQAGVIDVDLKGKERYKVAFSKSGYNGWIYISKISDSEFTQAMKPTIIGVVLMSVFMLVVMIIIAYVSSDYFSKPIRELQKFIPKMQKDGVKDEFEMISKSIRDVIEKNQSLENIVTSQHEQLKTLFMHNLFHGRMNEREISEGLYDFNYPRHWSCLYVLVIQFDSIDNCEYTRKDKDLLLFSVNQIVSEMIDKEEQLSPTVIDSNTQATIFICKDKEYDKHVLLINQFAEKIQETVRKIFNLSVSVGISSPFEVLTESELALEQAVESLKYRLKVGKESIIYYESVSAIINNNQINTYFPKMLENQLFDNIKLGESDKAKETLHQLLADLFKLNKNPHELEVNIMRFLNDLMSLMQIMGMDTLVIEDHKSLYHAISEMKTSEEIELFVKNKIVYPMIDTISERTDSQYKSISDKIIHIIQSEYDTELSLEIIASRLHYNKNYLSSIFKKEFKQSFSEYLALYRFDMAKKWLKETNLSVRVISEKLQYNNSQNFIRSFRKIEGTTPGKYRELHREDSLSC